jgi:N-acetylglucosaminyldiphosphoundecaprenol N-acetyl-beta-D-mannosaminyltransferase
MWTQILSFNIFDGSKKELIDYVLKQDKINIISGNPEILYNGTNNATLLNTFKSKTSVIIPDGVGIVISSKIVGKPVRQKIPGIEVMEDLINHSFENKKSIYLLGTKKDVLNDCIYNLKNKYPGLNIVGSHDGFFDLDDCTEIINDINSKKPYILFVAMGSPRQELFITKYMDILCANIFMGVGGSFDIFAGKLKRAPRWMISFGIEWLYRVSKEPWRIKRLVSIPKFIFKVLKDKYYKSDK